LRKSLALIEVVYLTDRPVEALKAWMAAARIDKGTAFRRIGRWGTISERALDPQSVNAMLKQRAEMARLEPADFSAHGLRSGNLTEAANRGSRLFEAMEWAGRHRQLNGMWNLMWE
jgi:integrase